MGVPLEPFITGIPEYTLGIPKTPEEISIQITKNINSGAGSGDTSGTNSATIEQNKRGIINRVIIKASSLNDGGVGDKGNAAFEIIFRDKRVVYFSYELKEADGGAVQTDIYETFDLINPITTQGNDIITYNCYISGKTPEAAHSISLDSSIFLIGYEIDY